MSDAKRYAMTWGKDEDGCIYVSPVESANGKWVDYTDYAKLRMERIHDLNQMGGLQEENARLKAEVERLEKTEEYLQNTLNQYALDDMRLTADLARLRASSFVTAVPVEHYERVIKAGDLLCFHYISLARKRWPDDPLPSSVTEWNAAKEGKPSV